MCKNPNLRFANRPWMRLASSDNLVALRGSLSTHPPLSRARNTDTSDSHYPKFPPVPPRRKNRNDVLDLSAGKRARNLFMGPRIRVLLERELTRAPSETNANICQAEGGTKPGFNMTAGTNSGLHLPWQWWTSPGHYWKYYFMVTFPESWTVNPDRVAGRAPALISSYSRDNYSYCGD